MAHTAVTAGRRYTVFRFLRRFIFAWCYKSFFLTSAVRVRLLRLTGMHIGKNVFIGHSVLFDDLYPANIFIGDNTIITSGTKIITHFYVPQTRTFTVGEVRIGANCFIGMNTLIVKPVTIGSNAVVGGGSVVTKDIAPGTVCAGVPCRVIISAETGKEQ